MKNLWIAGAGGIVGSLVVTRAIKTAHFDHIGAFEHHLTAHPALTGVTWAALDIGDSAAVQAAAQYLPPSVIINTAAMTHVDLCETRREEACRANSDGPRNLAYIARAYHAQLIHVSTDYIFPGNQEQPGPYRENAPPGPINYYGRTKLDGEEAIKAACANETPYTIVRTALVYGVGKRMNFVCWLTKELQAGKRVRVVSDQFNTPTLADDLADVLLWMAGSGAKGIYHAAGPDFLGRHEWALAIARHFRLDETLIDWVTTAELAQTAPRPLMSGLVCERLRADEPGGAPKLRGVALGLSDVDWMSMFDIVP